MLHIIFLILITVSAVAKIETLTQYNKSLVKKLQSDFPDFSPKKLKHLQIRLGTEVSSADSYSYKQNELLKLLEYATYATSISKNKNKFNFIKSYWQKYLSLPNPSEKSFEVEYLQKFFPKKEENPWDYLKSTQFFIDFSADFEKRDFFIPLFQDRCKLLFYLRKTIELESCWRALESLAVQTQNRILVQTDIFRNKMYYYSKPSAEKQFFELIEKIRSTPELKQFQIYAEWSQLKFRFLMTDKDLSKEIADLSKNDKSPAIQNRMLIRYYVARNLLGKALNLYNAADKNSANKDELIALYLLASEIFFRQNKLEKAVFYLNKSIQLETKFLQQLPLAINKVMLLILMDKMNLVKDLNSEFYKFQRIMHGLKIDDPELISNLKLGLFLTGAESIASKELELLSKEFKRHQFPNSYSFILMAKTSQFLYLK
jgi:hypothetical protein